MFGLIIVDIITNKSSIVDVFEYILIVWGISSVGRASGWQPEGHRFKSVILHFNSAHFGVAINLESP